MQLIRDIYPVDGPPHNRLEALELFMSIRIFDLGKESQVLDSILPTCLVLSCLVFSPLSHTISHFSWIQYILLFIQFSFQAAFLIICFWRFSSQNPVVSVRFSFLITFVIILIYSCKRLWWQSLVWWIIAQGGWEED